MAPKTAEKKPVKAAQKAGGKKGGKATKKGTESWKVCAVAASHLCVRPPSCCWGVTHCGMAILVELNRGP